MAYLQELCRYWADDYDAARARLNAFPQLRTVVDGLGIHSTRPDPPSPHRGGVAVKGPHIYLSDMHRRLDILKMRP